MAFLLSFNEHPTIWLQVVNHLREQKYPSLCGSHRLDFECHYLAGKVRSCCKRPCDFSSLKCSSCHLQSPSLYLKSNLKRLMHRESHFCLKLNGKSCSRSDVPIQPMMSWKTIKSMCVGTLPQLLLRQKQKTSFEHYRWSFLVFQTFWYSAHMTVMLFSPYFVFLSCVLI